MTGTFDSIPLRRAGWESPVPGLERCFEPQAVDELGQLLATASQERRALLIVGGGTRIGCANASEPISWGLSTLGLRGVDVFEPDEGVLHARAGTPVAEVQALARTEGWELPIDAPGVSSTVGGVIASAAVGPRAQAFGRVADAVLGLEVVGADGKATKCGGRVVKNVTGYDLAKLYCGSFGSLGVLTGAWLRLRPRPVAMKARVAPLPTHSGGFDACRALARLTSVRALVWVEGDAGAAAPGVYLELGGSEAEVAHDLSAVEAELAVQSIPLEGIDSLRDARAESRGDSVRMRARVLGADSAMLCSRLRTAGLCVSVDLGLGVIHARGEVESREALLELRRAAVGMGGFMVFETMPDDWRAGLDVFGPDVGTTALSRSIQQRFDPHRILNPGRFTALS
jgi:glycolate oxidase FAD binding subunit